MNEARFVERLKRVHLAIELGHVHGGPAAVPLALNAEPAAAAGFGLCHTDWALLASAGEDDELVTNAYGEVV